MQFFERGGWWLPDGEAHLQDWMTTVNDVRGDRLLYQGRKYREALKWCKSRRVAVDVGAHVGFFSWQMAQDFGQVEAFEPMPEHRACWEMNIDDQFIDCTTLHPVALGTENDGTVTVSTRTPGSSGDTGVMPDGTEGGIVVPLRTLDSYELEDVDFIKIDCEGYELFVLQGARETLLRCKPCVMVEQKPETGGAQRYGIGVLDAVEYLQSLGAVLRNGIQGDYMLSWD